MGNELVVKDNALINASYSLSLIEQRLILLAIVALRDDLHNKPLNSLLDKPIRITANSYIKTFKVDPSTAYKGLKDACRTLFARQFSYQETREKGYVANFTSRWVQKIAYIDNLAAVEFLFAVDVIPLITELEKHLTSYELKQVASLKSGYAIRLYELLISWRSVGKTPFISLQDFRQKMGILDTEYQRMGPFKERVLHIALEQINEHTDIIASYEQHKEGRTITGFSFQFKSKTEEKKISQRDQDTPDLFVKMTDPQRHLFANKLSKLPEMSHYSQGTESYEQFANRIADMILDPEKFQELLPYLKQVGFKV